MQPLLRLDRYAQNGVGFYHWGESSISVGIEKRLGVSAEVSIRDSVGSTKSFSSRARKTSGFAANAESATFSAPGVFCLATSILAFANNESKAVDGDWVETALVVMG